MTSVITGDIINSQKVKPSRWLTTLKKALEKLGDSPKQWEIYRGDSFQIEIKNAAHALKAAIQIKAAVKSKEVDVRVAIGIGEKKYNAKRISESNGSAFVYSGELIEQLKNSNVNMGVKSKDPVFDKEMNLYLKLALYIMDGWTANSAETVYAALQYPNKSQEALGKLLKIKQNAVSARLKRAGYDDILALIQMYQDKISQLP